MANIPPPLHESEGFLPVADASCSVTIFLPARHSLINGKATKIPHIFLFPSHPRYSVALRAPYESLAATAKKCEPRKVVRIFLLQRRRSSGCEPRRKMRFFKVIFYAQMMRTDSTCSEVRRLAKSKTLSPLCPTKCPHFLPAESYFAWTSRCGTLPGPRFLRTSLRHRMSRKDITIKNRRTIRPPVLCTQRGSSIVVVGERDELLVLVRFVELFLHFGDLLFAEVVDEHE